MSSNPDKSVMFHDEVKDMEVSSEGNSQPLGEQEVVQSKPKFHMLKKLFMPWKWKKKKKSDKFKAISKTLERKISVRVSKDKLVEMGLIAPAELDHKTPVPTEASSDDNPCYDHGENALDNEEFPISIEEQPDDSENEFTLARAGDTSWVASILIEAKGMLDFNTEVSIIEVWIREKELLVSQGDLGKDHEHCIELQKKLDDVGSVMRVDDSTIKNIFDMATKLCSDAGSLAPRIVAKKNEIGSKFQGLQESRKKYREKLEVAENMHAFQRDTDESLARMKEKLLIIDTNDLGKDLREVKELTKKLDGVEECFAGFEQRIRDHENEAAAFLSMYPYRSNAVQEKIEMIQNTLVSANKKILLRRGDLESSYQYHQFVFNCKEFQVWFINFDKMIKSVVTPKSVDEADAFMSIHHDRKVELNGRRDVFEVLKKVGDNLIAERHTESNSIAAEMEKNLEIRENVEYNWETSKHQLHQGHQLFIFKQQHTRTIGWIEEKEGFLNNHDCGDSIGTVEALIRKHEGFLITLENQDAVIGELERNGEKLMQDNHPEVDMITNIIEASRACMVSLKGKCDTRYRNLEDSRYLHQFVRKVNDTKSWLKEKTHVALDESYYDLSNLQNKIQKHTSFEAEIAANKPRMLAVREEGEELCRKSHFASQDILNLLEDLQSEWDHLLETSTLKKCRLQDANSALIYLHSLDEFDSWLEDTEDIIESEEHGKDLNSVSKSLKKLQAAEDNILSRKTLLTNIEDQFEKFENSNHFMLEKFEDRFLNIQQKFDALHEPTQTRKTYLEDTLLLLQFNRDVADELFWVEEKLTLASSPHLGTSLSEVESLQLKHHKLESDLISHDKVVNSHTIKAEQLVRANHYASHDIKDTTKQLKEKYYHLKDVFSQRKLRLHEAAESQQFYLKLNEAYEWIHENEPIINDRDNKSDEDSVHIYLKKVNDLVSDATNFKQKLHQMETNCERLIEREHFDSSNIQEKMQKLNAYFEVFAKHLDDKKQRLLDQKAAIEFFHETDEVTEWLSTQMSVAASEDYGKDVSHVEMLIKTFDSFMQTIISSEERIDRVTKLSTKLIEENNTDRDTIASKTKEIHQLWEDLKELATARQEALSGAKQVHVYDKNADETISWIGEKEAAISSDEVGQDLETIQTLHERQQGVQRDITVIKQQVASVDQEAAILCELFPDAATHIDAKRDDTTEALANLLHMSASRDERLIYFDDYRELMAWSSELMAKITSPDLAGDLTGADTLIARHKEIRSEIDSRVNAFVKFETSGKELMSGGHFMSTEILEKISLLDIRKEGMMECWNLRDEVYKQHWDYLVWVKETDAIDFWMSSREINLLEDDFGSNIAEVEELIKRQQDFEGTITAKEADLGNVHRITRIEENFVALREREDIAKREDRARREQERLEGIKKKELTRISNERRREEHEKTVGFFKRGQSMRLEPSKLTRTPSFTTRRKTQSFRRHTKDLSTALNLPPVEVGGYLDKKQELQNGGKRATIRSWKTHYTVLCGQLMCFFKDQDDFIESKAASAPIMIYQASVETLKIWYTANDYFKRKFVFRLHSTDGSQFLFAADGEEQQQEWVQKIKFHAGLPPSQQLTSYKTIDESKEVEGSPLQPTNPTTEPVYANIPASNHTSLQPHVSPPLPATHPPVDQIARPSLRTSSSRTSLHHHLGTIEPDSSGLAEPLYANVGQASVRSLTLPNRHSRVSDDSLDAVSSTSKEKKGSVLGRLLGRKKLNY